MIDFYAAYLTNDHYLKRFGEQSAREVEAAAKTADALTCPFCGGEAKIALGMSYIKPTVSIVCGRCHVRTCPLSEGTMTGGRTLSSITEAFNLALDRWNNRCDPRKTAKAK